MKKIDTGNKQMIRNIMANLVAFVVQLGINLYIAPVIVQKVNSSAYGFMNLANDFVSYASVITSIFNSVAARFIADDFYQGKHDEVNKYFNSLLVTNIVLSIIFAIIGFLVIPVLDGILHIPDLIVNDVKITFALIFLSYIVTLLTMVFTTSTFVTNRTDIQGTRNILNNVLRFVSILLIFNFVSVKLYWVAAATLIANVVVGLLNIKITKALTPELKINVKTAEWKYVAILAKSGCWMAITSISSILMRGLDLIIVNQLLGSEEMGLLSIARTMPNNITSVINMMAPLFTPVFILYYSRNEWRQLKINIEKSVHYMSGLLFVPIIGFIVLSHDFYKIWQPSLTSMELYIVVFLSTITVIQAFFNSTTATLAQISVVTNKLKVPGLISLLCGILNVFFAVVLIKFTPLGILGIAVSSTVIMILRYVIFNPIYAAYCLNFPLTSFYKSQISTWVSIPIILISMLGINKAISAVSFRGLMIKILLCGSVGYLEIAFIMFNKEVKHILKGVLGGK